MCFVPRTISSLAYVLGSPRTTRTPRASRTGSPMLNCGVGSTQSPRLGRVISARAESATKAPIRIDRPLHPQCSVHFLQKEWSERYDITFFTCSVVGFKIHEKSFATFQILLQAGKNNWTVDRRFSDFDALYSALKKAFPSLQLPKLPSKSWGTKLGSSFLAQRQQDLEDFLTTLMAVRTDKADMPEHHLVRAFLDLDRKLEGDEGSDSESSDSEQDSECWFQTESGFALFASLRHGGWKRNKHDIGFGRVYVVGQWVVRCQPGTLKSFRRIFWIEWGI